MEEGTPKEKKMYTLRVEWKKISSLKDSEVATLTFFFLTKRKLVACVVKFSIKMYMF